MGARSRNNYGRRRGCRCFPYTALVSCFIELLSLLLLLLLFCSLFSLERRRAFLAVYNLLGQLFIYSIKFSVLRLIKELGSNFDSSRPLLLVSPYVITRTDSQVEQHTCKMSRFSLKSLLGSKKQGITSAPEVYDTDCQI